VGVDCVYQLEDNMAEVKDFLTFCKCFLESDLVEMEVKCLVNGVKVFMPVDLEAEKNVSELVDLWENGRKLGFSWGLKS
jgi:hypothetical protein